MTITPPSELQWQWWATWRNATDEESFWQHFATRAAQWGADQELEACCALMDDWGLDASDLRAARRPKPPSLKKQACDALDAYVYGNPDHGDKQNTCNIIRRALEALPND